MDGRDRRTALRNTGCTGWLPPLGTWRRSTRRQAPGGRVRSFYPATGEGRAQRHLPPGTPAHPCSPTCRWRGDSAVMRAGSRSESRTAERRLLGVEYRGAARRADIGLRTEVSSDTVRHRWSHAAAKRTALGMSPPPTSHGDAARPRSWRLPGQAQWPLAASRRPPVVRGGVGVNQTSERSAQPDVHGQRGRAV